MILPLVFGTTIDTIPHFDRYMYASDEHVKKWDAFVGQMSGPKIGIVARGSSSFVNDKNRGFDLKAVVAAMPKNASYIVLQTDLSDDEHVFIDSVTTFLHPVRSLSLFPIWPRYVSILLR